ncbi:helix-turn-helix domain-containing protein [Actinomadura rayongensis]|uniref:Helix-turn-helix domain-containing protein n=1 Tax=Actinomadura rayongensis TaxID=1429076 RepID=A0A6I4W8V0_9ACTN|nr:helix-turn-helix domain-containing protein [Actinomadura rayongensis]
MARGLTLAEVRSLPVCVDLVTAGRVLGVGRTTAYQLARTGRFPCQVLRVGGGYRVATADLLTLLGLAPVGTEPCQPTPHGQPSPSRGDT